MSSIRTDLVALDTNEFIIALRNDPPLTASTILVRDRLSELSVFLPLQVLVELNDNLLNSELNELFPLLKEQGAVFDYTPALPALRKRYEQLGAKKGDAVIAAQIDAADVKWLISETATS